MRKHREIYLHSVRISHSVFEHPYREKNTHVTTHSDKCSVALTHGAVGWSAVCDCGISCSYSLNFRENNAQQTTFLPSSLLLQKKKVYATRKEALVQ